MHNFTTLVLSLSFCAAADAQPDTVRKPVNSHFNLHVQTTYIYQYSARFHAPYSGRTV
jgi:hypothetical protein